MDRRRYVSDPNQTLHPGIGRTEYYNDTNGAVYQTQWHDSHGNTFTQSNQLGPAERYGYNYVTGNATPPPVWSPNWPQPGGGGHDEPTYTPDPRMVAVSQDMGRQMTAPPSEDGGGIILLVLGVLCAVVGLPLIVAILAHRHADRRGKQVTAIESLALLWQPAWLVWLWYWVEGGTVAVVLASILTIVAPTYVGAVLYQNRRHHPATSH